MFVIVQLRSQFIKANLNLRKYSLPSFLQSHNVVIFRIQSKKKKGKKEIWSKYNCNAKLQIHFAGKEIEEREYIKKTFQRFCWISKACKSAPSLILEISSTKDSLLNVWLCTILLRGVRMKSMDSRYRDNRAPLIKKDKMAISVNIGAARSANICRRTFQPALSPLPLSSLPLLQILSVDEHLVLSRSNIVEFKATLFQRFRVCILHRR